MLTGVINQLTTGGMNCNKVYAVHARSCHSSRCFMRVPMLYDTTKDYDNEKTYDSDNDSCSK